MGRLGDLNAVTAALIEGGEDTQTRGRVTWQRRLTEGLQPPAREHHRGWEPPRAGGGRKDPCSHQGLGAADSFFLSKKG